MGVNRFLDSCLSTKRSIVRLRSRLFPTDLISFRALSRVFWANTVLGIRSKVAGEAGAVTARDVGVTSTKLAHDVRTFRFVASVRICGLFFGDISSFASLWPEFHCESKRLYVAQSVFSCQHIRAGVWQRSKHALLPFWNDPVEQHSDYSRGDSVCLEYAVAVLGAGTNVAISFREMRLILRSKMATAMKLTLQIEMAPTLKLRLRIEMVNAMRLILRSKVATLAGMVMLFRYTPPSTRKALI